MLSKCLFSCDFVNLIAINMDLKRFGFFGRFFSQIYRENVHFASLNYTNLSFNFLLKKFHLQDSISFHARFFCSHVIFHSDTVCVTCTKIIEEKAFSQ